MERNSFVDFVSEQILSSDMYDASDKRLSFSYKHDNDNDVLAYICLSAINAPIEQLRELKGCCILGYFCEENDDIRILQLAEETLDRITMWIGEDDLPFDYVWYKTSSINSPNLFGVLDNATQCGNIIFQHI